MDLLTQFNHIALMISIGLFINTKLFDDTSCKHKKLVDDVFISTVRKAKKEEEEDRVKKEEEEDEGASDDDKAAEAGDDDEDFLIRDIRYKLEILGFFMFSVAKKFIQRWMK